MNERTTPSLLIGWTGTIRGRLFTIGDGTLILFTPRPAPPELLTGLRLHAERVSQMLVTTNRYEPEPVALADPDLFGPLPDWFDTEAKGDDRAKAELRGAQPEEGAEGQQAAPVQSALPEVPRPAQAAREMTAGGR